MEGERLSLSQLRKNGPGAQIKNQTNNTVDTAPKTPEQVMVDTSPKTPEQINNTPPQQVVATENGLSGGERVVDPRKYFVKEEEPRDFGTELLGQATMNIDRQTRDAMELYEKAMAKINDAEARGHVIEVAPEALEGMQPFIRPAIGGMDDAVTHKINQKTKEYDDEQTAEVLPSIVDTMLYDTDEVLLRSRIEDEMERAKITGEFKANVEVLEDNSKSIKLQGVSISAEEATAKMKKEQPSSKTQVTTRVYSSLEEEAESSIEEGAEFSEENMQYKEDDIEVKQYSAKAHIGGEETMANEDQEYLSLVRSKIREKINPQLAKFDISSFTVQKPVKAAGFGSVNTDSTLAVLPYTNWVFELRAFGGKEIANIGGGAKTVRKQNLNFLKLFYDHITSDKPSFDVFCRTVLFDDLDHMYACMLESTFRKTLFVPYSCIDPSCENLDVEEFDVEDLKRYSSDEEKERIQSLYNNSPHKFDDEAELMYEEEIIPISQSYAIGFKAPSVGDILLDPMVLPQDYRETHDDELAMIGYIGTVYKIDVENQALVPIDFDKKGASTNQNIINRYKGIMEFLAVLSSDEYSAINGFISRIAQQHSKLWYVLPEHTCEKCKTLAAESTISAKDLLFLRHQLGVIVNM